MDNEEICSYQGLMERTLILLSLYVVWLPTSVWATSVDYIQQNAIRFYGNKIPNALSDEVKNKALLMIEESHGITEMPELTLEIIKSLSTKRSLAIGFEFPKDIESEVKNFIYTGDDSFLKKTTFFQDANFHSGRGSQSMVILLKALKKIRNIDVFCFDVPTQWQGTDRDTEMAVNVLDYANRNPSKLIITYSGNIHSRITPGFPGNPNHKNMGSEIVRLSQKRFDLTNSTNLLFRYSHGTAWQCWAINGKPECGPQNIEPSNSRYSIAVPFSRYFLKEPGITDGHQMVLFYPR